MPQELWDAAVSCGERHGLAHARRQFVHEVTSFPEECRFVLEQLKIVFKNDDEV